MKIFRYPGGKSRLTDIIVKYLEPHILATNVFHDVFVGGGSILSAVAQRFPDIKLYANDYDPNIGAFWKLIARGSDDQLAVFMKLLNRTPTIKMFNRLRQKKPNSLVHKAYHAIFFNRCTFSGIATAGPIGGAQQLSKWTVDCRYNPQTLKRECLRAVDCMRGRLMVRSEHFSDYLKRYEKQKACFYLDPPYFKKGRELYPVHMQGEEHKQLAMILKKIKRWVLSYDQCEEIESLYKFASIQTLAVAYSINGVKSKWANKNELIINRA